MTEVGRASTGGATVGDRALIHELNRRYHAEWVRAERLEQELADLRLQNRWGLGWLRRSYRKLIPRSAPTPRIMTRAEPYVPTSDSLARFTGLVSIIIPFRDQPGLLSHCIRGLRTSSYRRFELILVDNGSRQRRTRRLLERLRRRPDVDVVSVPGEFNFAKLCNAGASDATGDFLVFLNNDVEVLTPDWLERMLAVAVDPAVGVVGATLLYPDLTIQHVGIFPQSDGAWVHPNRGEEIDTVDELKHDRLVPAVTGACLMIRRDRFEDLGGFHENYPLDFNDVDLCQRVAAQGWGVVVSSEARLFHFESLSRGYSQAISKPSAHGLT